MTRIIFFFMLVLAGPSLYSQESAADKFYNRFRSYDEGHNLSISFNAGSSGNDKKGWFKKVVQFRMLVLDPQKIPTLGKDWESLSSNLHKEQYEDLVTVRKGKDRFGILSREMSGNMKDLVLVSNGKEGDCLFIQLKGRFSAADLDEIQSTFKTGE